MGSQTGGDRLNFKKARFDKGKCKYCGNLIHLGEMYAEGMGGSITSRGIAWVMHMRCPGRAKEQQ